MSLHPQKKRNVEQQFIEHDFMKETHTAMIISRHSIIVSIIVYVSYAVGIMQTCKAADEEWHKTSGALHLAADILTMGSIATGGVATIAGFNNNGDLEQSTSIASIALIAAGGITRGLADYFDAKASADLCDSEDCDRCYTQYVPHPCKYQNKYKQSSECYKLSTYLCYIGSTVFGIVSATAEDVRPTFDTISLILAGAAVVCNKNIFRYGYIYTKKEVEYRDKINQLGSGVLQAQARNDQERLQQWRILRNVSYYSQWAISMREISQYFLAQNRYAPAQNDTEDQLDRYENLFTRPPFTQNQPEIDLFHAQLTRELDNTGGHLPGEPRLVDQAAYPGFPVLN